MTKMVIVMRRDLHMRKGKIAAQACHGAVSVVLRTLDRDGIPWCVKDDDAIQVGDGNALGYESALAEWFDTSYTKVCLYVDSEDELLNLKKKADDAGILTSLVRDNGTTEFHGVKTYTCLVFEPLDSKVIDPITGNLPLY